MEPGDGGDRKRPLTASGLDSSADAGDNPPSKAHRSAGPKKAFLMNSETNLSTSVGESSVRRSPRLPSLSPLTSLRSNRRRPTRSRRALNSISRAR